MSECVKIAFVVDRCSKCPCLRNNSYGEWSCFLRNEYLIDEVNIDYEVPDWCPGKEDENA